MCTIFIKYLGLGTSNLVVFFISEHGEEVRNRTGQGEEESQ